MTAATDRFNSIYVPLRVTYGFVPLVAGIDKFFNILTDWQHYLPDLAAAVLPIPASQFMLIVGVIEIVAGLAVLSGLTRLGSYVVAAWLVLIALNLTAAGLYDIAVRDLVMAVGAYTLGQVASLRREPWLALPSRPSASVRATASAAR